MATEEWAFEKQIPSKRFSMRRKKMPEDNHILAYYQGISNGSIPVGRWIELLYEYLVTGLAEKRFFFDQKKASDAINWIEGHCFHTEGPLAPSPIKLELWQRAMISAIFGIVDEKGNRQFREVLLVVARKNGKSLIASSIGNYIWRCDGGYGAKVFCCAPKLDQADLCYSAFEFNVDHEPALGKKTKSTKSHGLYIRHCMVQFPMPKLIIAMMKG